MPSFFVMISSILYIKNYTLNYLNLKGRLFAACKSKMAFDTLIIIGVQHARLPSIRTLNLLLRHTALDFVYHLNGLEQKYCGYLSVEFV